MAFAWHVFLGLLLTAAGRLAAAEAAPATTRSDSSSGRLNVEGDALERVFLGRVEAGGLIDPQKALVLHHPKGQVVLPAGPYAVLKIELKGSYVHTVALQLVEGKVRLPREAERLTILPGRPCSLKVGLPLKPVLLAVRRGRTIQVLCGLYDAQSRYYAARAQDKPPQFTISCNDREIGSGAFQCARGGTYGFSWRVPFTVFNGPLCIVASVDLGEMGHRQSQPVLVPWHWYDQLADFAGWALLGVLLVLVKENRNRQALTILIPFLLLSEVLWPWIAYLLALLSVDTSQVSYPYQWLAVTWTALWLMGPWLARFCPAPAVGLALLLAAAVGAVAELGLSQRFVFSPALMNYAILVLALLLALVLSGLCCRRNYSPRSFALWLVPWLIVGAALGATAELVRLYAYASGRVALPPITQFLPGLIVSSLCFAGMLYLFSLPYLYVAFRSALYGERFRKVLRLPEYVPPMKPPPATSV
jgi:hypothetical protein